MEKTAPLADSTHDRTEAQALPLRLRWENKTRYYEAHVEQDLWGEWVLTRVWGRRGSPMGQIRRMPCQSYEDAQRKLAGVERQRQQHGYQSVAPTLGQVRP